MSEMALTADRLVIIGRGRLLADASVGELIARVGVGRVLVRSPHATDLRDLLVGQGATVTSAEPGVLQVDGLTARTIADLAVDRGLAVHELTPQRASLEQAYMDLTRDAVQYRDEERVMSP
jgi:ABC-2 type transport system ATP-binding protein